MSDATADVKTLVSTLRNDFVNTFTSKDELHALQPKTKLKDSNPTTELQKLSQIIKAHTTKIGIISQPQKFNANITAALRELQHFSNSVFFLFSLLPLFYQGKFTNYFNELLDSCILGLLNGINGFCDEIDQLLDAAPTDDSSVNAAAESEDPHSNTRLISVGKIWSSCDSLDELATTGNLGILNKKILVSAKLVGDTLAELEEWLVDPHVESDDPFGIGSESDNESDNESGSETGEKASPEMIKFVEEWQTKLKMIRLLLLSFSKSIASNDYKNKEPMVEQLDKLNNLHAIIVEKVDELISTVFMLGLDFDSQDEEIVDLSSQLNTSVRQMVQIIKTLTKGDDKKGKWIEVWDVKYFT
ncbi:LANO_0C05138g1_1 [Lachancea nothofagi CBS 11611]|uniref:LANO_0C05138g1_1 n=1 Tax=Lachancea nothofagi CBS 11611 TaxID=1266666 RepID=A0A1G4J7D8_9SACH|nr:LANO_0C05138g1_1 [Lachancea nothofagi CBS 11611]